MKWKQWSINYHLHMNMDDQTFVCSITSSCNRQTDVNCFNKKKTMVIHWTLSIPGTTCWIHLHYQVIISLCSCCFFSCIDSDSTNLTKKRQKNIGNVNHNITRPITHCEIDGFWITDAMNCHIYAKVRYLVTFF